MYSYATVFIGESVLFIKYCFIIVVLYLRMEKEKTNDNKKIVENNKIEANDFGKDKKLILNLRFFNGKTQMEVAEEIGISQAQVSRLEKTALKHMKNHV